jgi:hypothetical protein
MLTSALLLVRIKMLHVTEHRKNVPQIDKINFILFQLNSQDKI